MTHFLKNLSISYLVQQLKTVALRRHLLIKYIDLLFHLVTTFFFPRTVFFIFWLGLGAFLVLFPFFLMNGCKGWERKNSVFLHKLCFCYGIYHEIISQCHMTLIYILFWSCFVFWYYNHDVTAVEFFLFQLSPCLFHVEFCKITFRYPKHRSFLTTLTSSS